MPRLKTLKLALFVIFLFLLLAVFLLFFFRPSSLETPFNINTTPIPSPIALEEEPTTYSAGVQKYLVTGIIKEKPVLSANGALQIKIGFLDENKSTLELNAFFLKGPSEKESVSITKEGETDSTLLSSSEAVGLLENHIGKTITLSIVSGETTQALNTFLDNTVASAPSCDSDCKLMIRAIKEASGQTIASLAAIQSGKDSNDPLVATTILVNIQTHD